MAYGISDKAAGEDVPNTNFEDGQDAIRDDSQNSLDDEVVEDEELDEGQEIVEESDTRPKGIFRMRPSDDEEPRDWWFASTAIPLIGACTGPLANVLSIGALITSWRCVLPDGGTGLDDYGVPFADPRWCISLNAVSLVCGCLGNLFLLFNFTQRIRYIIALPATIISWYFATGILMGITIAMNTYVPPTRPEQTYTQGFWMAVLAACLYLFSSMILMINMLGYFLGHYPQHFTLTDDQRNLILQTIMFFIWLAGGAGVFSKVCDWSFADSLYFCDVTILTVGFGDFAAPNDVGRGLVFPYSVGGIIILGLMVGSIVRFVHELGEDMVVKQHVEKRRIRTVGRSITLDDLTQDQIAQLPTDGKRPVISRPLPPHDEKPIQILGANDEKAKKSTGIIARIAYPKPVRRSVKRITGRKSKHEKLLVMREERDRFEAMRRIQRESASFKKWYALTMSVIAFGLLWCCGAVVFWVAEQRIQQLTYFEALYFCYVSLLTIGYGDFAPKSNAGKPFFIVWSLIAVPTMTVLISDLGDTVIDDFKKGTFKLADWTVLPKQGIYTAFVQRNRLLQNWRTKREERKRIAAGFPTGAEDTVIPSSSSALDTDTDLEKNPSRPHTRSTTNRPMTSSSIPSTDGALGSRPGKPPRTLEALAEESTSLTPYDLALRLAQTLSQMNAEARKSTSHDPYTYEQWVEFTRLIRFSSLTRQRERRRKAQGQNDDDEVAEEESESGVVDWDWIGEDSPMVSEKSETEWVLDRLLESLVRWTKQERDRQRVIMRRRVARERERGITGAGIEGSAGAMRQRGMSWCLSDARRGRRESEDLIDSQHRIDTEGGPAIDDGDIDAAEERFGAGNEEQERLGLQRKKTEEGISQAVAATLTRTETARERAESNRGGSGPGHVDFAEP